MKKIIALLLAFVLVFSLAACGKDDTETDTNADTSEDQPEATQAPVQGTTDDATDDTTGDTADDTPEPVTIKFSWWGGDTRHDATIAAVKKFMDTYPYITVETQYGAWTDWETNMATAFATQTAPDINQINWNWITSFSSDGSVYMDLKQFSDIIDLSQYDQGSLDQCTLAGELQAIPVSMTGRIFYWNKATFDQAGIPTPTSLEELYAAGETFKTVLGEDYYPLGLNEYDRMILMVYYLESVYGKAWVVDNALQYTKDEIKAGFDFIQSLEDKHVIPSIETVLGDGAASMDKNPKWIEGKYAGIFEWDSSASKFKAALADGGTGFMVGDYFKDFGEYQGGYSKVSLAFAITETTKHPKECAMLIEFLLNEPAGIELLASERGIPLNKNAFQLCTDKGLLDATTAEANKKVLSWVSFPLDPLFEAAELKTQPDGYYWDIHGGFSYGEYPSDEAAQLLIDAIEEVYGD
jgi:oligogalacturonide transport system substrate-binding protein